MKQTLNTSTCTVAVSPLRGFTLIELMITVAIVAILASVAYPAYTGAVLKGRRAEGRTALADLMQQQERYLTQTGSYMSFTAGATGNNGATAAAVSGVSIPFKTFSGDGGIGRAAYRLAAEACPAASGTLALNACVRLVAEPTGSDPQAGNLRMMSTGFKDCFGGSQPTVCWR